MVPSKVSSGGTGPSIEELAHRIVDGKLTLQELSQKLIETGATPTRAAALMAKVFIEVVRLNRTMICV